ncbi:MAG: hypothetical protein OEV85_12400 [Candidatus Thorarchaeota archaeon]|nr:hypothetical protein [Candidatus Thorarchaeota archaeon]
MGLIIVDFSVNVFSILLASIIKGGVQLAGSMKSAFLFLVGALFCAVQLIISIVVFDSGIVSMTAGVFDFVMFIGYLFARSGKSRRT